MELVVSTFIVLAIAAVASLVLYRRIRAAEGEYEAAKGAVRSITLGFTRQVNRLQQDIAHAENGASTAKIAAAEALKGSGEAKEATLRGLEAVKGLGDRVQSAETAVDEIRREVQKIAQQPRTRAAAQEQIPAAIPVQQSNVLGGLTETELGVLKRIADLGEGTVPEIRELIGLTREHTARMLKRLYESGYVDRNTSGMPYRYSVRREIRDLIQRQPEQKPGL